LEIQSDDIKPASVVCTWYLWYPPLSLGTFVMSPSSQSIHCRINEYAFTLTEGCFETEQIEKCTMESSIFEHNAKKLKLASSNFLIVCQESLQFIAENLRNKAESSVIEVDNIPDAVGCNRALSVPSPWRRYGCYNLTMQHRSQLLGGQLLCDIHIGAAQALINQQFPSIGGLRNTVMQNSEFI